jgi:acetylornithine/succinyldiaminopimelate/putrescine aminotransferase
MTAARHIALIFDEIQCGLGRLGHLFAYERVNVVPDMVTLAKPLAGGPADGAVLMTEPIAAAMKPGDHGTDVRRRPLRGLGRGVRGAALADPALLAHVRENGQWLAASSRRWPSARGACARCAARATCGGVDTHEPAARSSARARDAGCCW